MWCCANPAPSSAAESPDSSAREAATQFEAILFAQAFGALAKPMGFYGDIVVAETARALARNERGGLADHLERLFARA
jgi:hypothetical protein